VDTQDINAADGLRSARAWGTSDKGKLNGYASGKSSGSKITAISQPSATFNDVIVSWDGDGPPPDFANVDTVLNYRIDGAQSTSGQLGSGGFNVRQIIYSVNFNGASDSGQITWDPGGDSGQNLLGDHELLSPLVPVDTPVTITFSMFIGAQARMTQVGSTVTTTVQGILTVTEESQESSMPQSTGSGSTTLFAEGFPGPVFGVPEGFTVNSVSMGIVDNHWVEAPVPEPATALVGALGGTLALCLRRKRVRGGR
jgi:hypothetical protein